MKGKRCISFRFGPLLLADIQKFYDDIFVICSLFLFFNEQVHMIFLKRLFYLNGLGCRSLFLPFSAVSFSSLYRWKMAECYWHRLNMELDLHSLFGLHVYSCTHWLRLRNPPPPHLGSYSRPLLDDTSFFDPWLLVKRLLPYIHVNLRSSLAFSPVRYRNCWNSEVWTQQLT